MRRNTISGVVSVVFECLGIAMQVLLTYFGIELFFADHDDLSAVMLILWCTLASAYLLCTIIGLNIAVRLDRVEPDATRRVLSHPLVRLLSTILTFAVSLLGIREAVILIINIGQEQVDVLVEVGAVWTMLLSWAMFHWGYARIYYARYHRASEAPLIFPGSDEPRLTDFVYFSFTNATTFAVSDVQVATSRMRWTVVWHTCLAFFFNALIIALSMNVIAKGDLFAALLE